jgi:hypothetical protein
MTNTTIQKTKFNTTTDLLTNVREMITDSYITTSSLDQAMIMRGGEHKIQRTLRYSTQTGGYKLHLTNVPIMSDETWIGLAPEEKSAVKSYLRTALNKEAELNENLLNTTLPRTLGPYRKVTHMHRPHLMKIDWHISTGTGKPYYSDQIREAIIDLKDDRNPQASDRNYLNSSMRGEDLVQAMRSIENNRLRERTALKDGFEGFPFDEHSVR